MVFLAANGVYKKYSHRKHDAIEKYYDFIDKINYDYVEKANLNEKYSFTNYEYDSNTFYRDDSKYDYYNGYHLDDFGNPLYIEDNEDLEYQDVAEYTTSSPIELISTCSHFYFIIGNNYSLYQCDNCMSYFLDKNDYYVDNRTKESLDKCCDCYSKEKLQEKRINFGKR